MRENSRVIGDSGLSCIFIHVMHSLKSSAAGRFSASESVSVFSTIDQSYKCVNAKLIVD